MMRLLLVHQQPKPAFYRQPKACTPPATSHHRRKPNWLRLEVLRLKAHMPRAGCRAVAHTFNRLHPGVSVGKTFVADLIARHQQEIADLRRQIRSAKPRAVAVNNTWAMDMTFFTDTQRITHAAIGIIDHGSRVALRLQVLTRRCSWSMLGHLCLAIAQHGKPRKLRTDNEAVLNSWLFNSFLKFAGIQHQTTQKHAPWQNGRIERLFGTLKPLLRQLVIPSGRALQCALDEFKNFYNHVRPHQNLNGLTPAEHFAGLRPSDIRQMPIKEVTPVQALAGLMRGYWIGK
jgi:transposase InsO family protein